MFTHIYVKHMSTYISVSNISSHLPEPCALWVFTCASTLKICPMGVSFHRYLKDVYSGCFPAHLSERCLVWVFHRISILKICILGTLLYICLKDMHPDNVHTHLCETHVHLDIYVKYVHTGHSVYRVCPCTSVLKTCTVDIFQYISLTHLHPGHLPAQLF